MAEFPGALLGRIIPFLRAAGGGRGGRIDFAEFLQGRNPQDVFNPPPPPDRPPPVAIVPWFPAPRIPSGPRRVLPPIPPTTTPFPSPQPGIGSQDIGEDGEPFFDGYRCGTDTDCCNYDDWRARNGLPRLDPEFCGFDPDPDQVRLRAQHDTMAAILGRMAVPAPKVPPPRPRPRRAPPPKRRGRPARRRPGLPREKPGPTVDPPIRITPTLMPQVWEKIAQEILRRLERWRQQGLPLPRGPRTRPRIGRPMPPPPRLPPTVPSPRPLPVPSTVWVPQPVVITARPLPVPASSPRPAPSARLPVPTPTPAPRPRPLRLPSIPWWAPLIHPLLRPLLDPGLPLSFPLPAAPPVAPPRPAPLPHFPIPSPLPFRPPLTMPQPGLLHLPAPQPQPQTDACRECAAQKPKRKKRKQRTECRTGTYTETRRGLIKSPKRTIECR